MPTVIGQDQRIRLQATCKQCGAILEYLPKEVKEIHGRDYGGGSAGMKWIDCPQCSSKVILESW